MRSTALLCVALALSVPIWFQNARASEPEGPRATSLALRSLAVSSSWRETRSDSLPSTPDWVIEVDEYVGRDFLEYGYFLSSDFCDLPWEQIAWGQFDFHLLLNCTATSPEGIPCNVSYGNVHHLDCTQVADSCGDGCYLHILDIQGVVLLKQPTYCTDFLITTTAAVDWQPCISIPCEWWGIFEGTAYFYAKPTPADDCSWGRIKSRY
jgi:hypothetical protein